jgi:hypothetical protein
MDFQELAMVQRAICLRVWEVICIFGAFLIGLSEYFSMSSARRRMVSSIIFPTRSCSETMFPSSWLRSSHSQYETFVAKRWAEEE